MDESMPIYQQIMKYIEENIRNGVYQKGSIIPSEQEFCRQFNTSRMTVRRAIDALVKEGWLYRIQGRGTFISHLEIQKAYALHGFTENMIEMGYKPNSKVLNFELTKPDENIARMLKILPTDSIYILERIRMVDNEPIAIEKIHIPEKLCPGLMSYSFETNSLYEVLKNNYKIEAVYSQQKLNAVTIEGEQAKILFNKNKGVVLRMKNIVFDKNMCPIEYANSIYHGAKYTFNVILNK